MIQGLGLNRTVEFVCEGVVLQTVLLPQVFRCILGELTEFKPLTLLGSPLSARRKTIMSFLSHNSSFHDFLSWILQRIICKDLYGVL